MKITPEQRMRHYRAIYESLFADPFISKGNLLKVYGVLQKTASKRLKEAIEKLYIVGPGCRKLSSMNLLEYMYLFNADNPDIAYAFYREDPRVVYNAQIMGPFNSMVISREEMDIDGEVILKGPRSDYYVPFTPDQSWQKALQKMSEKIGHFDNSCAKKELIQNHWDQSVKWNETDELLYRYFKHDLRRKVRPLLKMHKIPKSTVYHWLETLDKRCTTYVDYYPDSLLGYDTYFYTFESEYEDFVVELFSEFPATVTFFKTLNTLILFAYVPKAFMRDTDPYAARKMCIPSLEIELLNKGIIKNKTRAIVEYSWSKDL